MAKIIAVFTVDTKEGIRDGLLPAGDKQRIGRDGK